MSDSSRSNQVSNLVARLEQTRQWAQDEAEETVSTSQVLHFQVGAGQYALPIVQVKGVDRLRPLTYVPGAPSFVLGVCNRRGTVLPCVNLGELLGVKGEPVGKESRLVIIQDSDGSGLIGLLVDRTHDVVNISSDSIEPPLPTLEHATMLSGQARLRNGQMLLLLEPKELLKRMMHRGGSSG